MTKNTLIGLSVALLLVLSMTGSTVVGSDDRGDYSIRTRQNDAIAVDQTGIWYHENVWIEFNPEGNIYANARLEGNAIGLDQLDLNQIVSPEINELLSWADFWTYPGNSPTENNAHISFTFKTNDPTVAEAAGRSIIDAVGSEVTVEGLNFDGSNGYDANYGDGFMSYTDVRFSGHVDWTNMQLVINNSIPRSYGGLAATIDVTEASDLNFHIWADGNSLAAAIGVSFHQQVAEFDGGHQYSLAELLHVSEFSVASFSDIFWMTVVMPTVSNFGISISNSSDTEVFIKRFNPREPHHNFQTTHVNVKLHTGATYSDIVIDFDYKFVPYSWRNFDRVNWNVDRRGYSEINLITYGLERAAPTPQLLANQSIFGDIMSANFRMEYPTTAIEGHHNFYLDVLFPLPYDFASANATATAIMNELNTLGLQFTGYNNFSNPWEVGENHWYHKNQTDIVANGITFFGFLDSRNQFENVIASTYAFGRSPTMMKTNLTSINSFNWDLYQDFAGAASSVEIRTDTYHWATPDLYTPFVQNADATTTVDLLRPIFLEWDGAIPWNQYTERVELHFRSPYIGSFEGIDFTPDTNNGYAWDSGRWEYNDRGTDYFEYEVRIYGQDPQIQDYNNGNPVNISSMTDIGLTFQSHYFGDDVDLEAPHISMVTHEEPGYGGTWIAGYPDYVPINDRTFSGIEDLAVKIEDYSYFYWNGTTNVNRFPSSGIANATSYFYRSDAPINHPIFKQDLQLSHDANWPYNSLNSQVWTSTLDTSTLPDGVWKLNVETFDNNGNFDDRFAGEFTVDNYDETYMPATITWNEGAPQEGEGVDGITYFNFTIEDDVGMYAVIAWNNLGGWFVEPLESFTNATGGYTTYSFMVDVEAQGLPEDYPMTITIEALDMDGHWSYLDVSVFVDNLKQGDPPTINLINPINGISVNNSLTQNLLFEASVEDDWGIKSVQLQIEGDRSREFSMTYNQDTGYYEFDASISTWALGSYTWNIVVTDVDQNTHVESADQPFAFSIVGEAPVIIDSESPEITLISHSDGETVSGKITITAEVTDDVIVSQVIFTNPKDEEKSMSDEGDGTYNIQWDSASVIDGEAELSITARDGEGNSNTLEFILVTDNGRVASDPVIGLPGFGMVLTLSSLVVIMPIFRRYRR